MNLKSKIFILLLLLFNLIYSNGKSGVNCNLNFIEEINYMEYVEDSPSEGVGLNLYGKNGVIYIIEENGIGTMNQYFRYYNIEKGNLKSVKKLELEYDRPLVYENVKIVKSKETNENLQRYKKEFHKIINILKSRGMKIYSGKFDDCYLKEIVRKKSK